MARFCSNCGKDIGDAPFCSNCGTKSGSSKGMSISKPNINLSSFGSIGYYWLMAIVSVVLSVMTLFNWFTVSIPSITTTKLNCFSFVFKVYNIAETFDIMEDFGLVIFFGVILLLLAVLVALFAITACRRALVESSEAILYSKLASGVSAALSVITIGIVSFAKNTLESEMGIIGSMAGDMMSLSSHPYIMLVISVVGIVFNGTMADKEKKSVTIDAMMQYSKVLKELENKEKYKFTLVNIYTDKIPELVIIPKGHEENDRVRIYKYSDGNVKAVCYYDNDTKSYIDFFGSKGTFGYKGHGNELLQKRMIDDDYISSEIYFISDDKRTLILDCIGQASERLDDYSIQGNKISESMYRSKFSGFVIVNEKSGYEINDTNIKQILNV